MRTIFLTLAICGALALGTEAQATCFRPAMPRLRAVASAPGRLLADVKDSKPVRRALKRARNVLSERPFTVSERKPVRGKSCHGGTCPLK